MLVTALLNATEPQDGEGGTSARLRALVPVLGQTLLERQAHSAMAAGISSFLIHIAQVEADVVQLADRLRARGNMVEFVRNLADVAAQIGPDQRLLLVAEGLHAPASLYSEISQSHGAATLLATGDSPFTRVLERIDAQHRWAGLAMINGAMVQQCRDMPDDWDISATLLRQAVQGGARRQPIDSALFELGQFALLRRAEDAAPVEAAILGTTQHPAAGTGQNFVWSPLLRLGGGALVRSGISVQGMFYAAAGLMLLATALMFSGWITIGLAVLLLALSLAATGRHLGLFRATDAAIASWDRMLRLASLFLPLPIAAALILRAGETLALMALATALACQLWVADRAVHAQKSPSQRSWAVPDGDMAVLIMAAGIWAGQPLLATACALLLAVCGLGMWLDRIFRNAV